MTRPDGRCFVIGEPDDELPAGRLYATADEADEERVGRLRELGFRQHRRELVVRFPTRVEAVEPPRGIAFLQADQVDETRLRLLDDELRHDVPGTNGWRWGADEFHRETYGSPEFDPATYLVAVDGEGEYVGIARAWMSAQPRLGFVGVRRGWRRRGVARALLAAVLNVLHARGVPDVVAEVDETNVASRSLLARFEAESVSSAIELVREGAVSH